MKKSGKILLVLLSASVLMVGVAMAEPNKHAKNNEKFENNSVDCKYKSKAGPGGYKEDLKCKRVSHTSFASNGPPPWAPAHGYRRKNYSEYGLNAYPIEVESGRCNREVIGQILGGAVGGLAGSQIGDGTGRLIAVAAGTLVGVVIGGEIGKSMDRADTLCIDQALEHAPDGSSIHWNDTDHQYTVTPKETVQDTDGRYCREYSVDAGVQGKTEQVYGRACRQPDGSWQIGS